MQPIVIIGVCDVEGSTNISLAKSFAKLGYPVVPVNYRTLIWKFGMPYFERLVLDTVERYEPHLTVFCKTNGISPDLISKCGKTFYWFMDPISTAEQCGAIPLAKAATYASCTGGGVAEWMKNEGLKNCYHIWDGCDHDIFKPVPAVPDYMADISFIGAKNPQRDEFLQALLNIGFRVKAYGSGYSTSAINAQFAQVCNSSKMMLSLNTYNDIPDYFSNRLLRYMGCGSCVLHWDPTETLQKYFKHMKEIVFFKDEDDLVEKAIALTDEQIGNIALGGRDKVLRNYTWDHTIHNILRRAE